MRKSCANIKSISFVVLLFVLFGVYANREKEIDPVDGVIEFQSCKTLNSTTNKKWNPIPYAHATFGLFATRREYYTLHFESSDLCKLQEGPGVPLDEKGTYSHNRSTRKSTYIFLYIHCISGGLFYYF